MRDWFLGVYEPEDLGGGLRQNAGGLQVLAGHHLRPEACRLYQASSDWLLVQLRFEGGEN